MRGIEGHQASNPHAQAPRASGTLASHYAPRAKVRLLDAQTLQAQLMHHTAHPIAVYARCALPTLKHLAWVEVRRMPDRADACAHELFAVLRELDERGAQEIWIETPPASPDWEGVLDRLTRAAA